MAQIPLRAESACANPVGRRQVLAGLALSQIATIAPLNAESTPLLVEGWKDRLATSRQEDAEFWALHERWLKVDAAWQADLDNYPYPGMPDEVMDRWGELHGVAEYMMLTARVTTLAALYTKMQAIQDEPDNFLRSETDGTKVFAAVMWDVERMIGREGAA